MHDEMTVQAVPEGEAVTTPQPIRQMKVVRHRPRWSS